MRVEQALRTRLADGTYPVRTWLPGLRDLMAEFGVTSYTAQAAIKRLIADDLVTSVHPLGTYVLDPAAPAEVPTRRPRKAPTERTGQDPTEKMLKERIADGTYPVGTKMPSHAQLCEDLGVSQHKVQQAIRRLTDAGLVMSVMGLGTVVTDPRVPSTGSAHRVSVEGGREEIWTVPRPGVTNAAHIRAVMKTRLTDGTYPPGERLPTYGALSGEFGVSVSAVQNALRPLKRERLICQHVSRQGMFAAPASKQPPSSRPPDQASA
ncbi:GntR family transcriptional regulator [Streptomyces sp. NPDC002680]|uniref:GntR family transcriptional regulator n=1 Tax=Streptomyces sp. NPDC002680 TaxID=3364659 RepID=UPI0036C9FB55